MIFGDDHYHPLDREYGQVWTPDSSEIIEPIEGPIQINKNRLTTKDVGSSAAMMQPGAETLKGRIMHGVSRVELAFMGQGKGSKEGLTPESFGKEEREAMRDLARINDIKVSTHATIGINGVSGFSNQESGFNEAARKSALTEIQRAVDFAADASTGGAVVVHTGEFPRSIAAYYGDEGIKKQKDTKFTGYSEEEQKAIHYLVDDHTGKIISAVKEDEVAWVAVPKKDENGKVQWMKEADFEKGSLREMEFEMIETYLKEIREKYKDKPEIVKRAEERFEDMKRVPIYKTDDDGNIQTELIKFSEFKRDFKNPDGTVNTEKATIEFFKKQMEAQLHQSLGSAREFEQHYYDGIKDQKELEDKYELYEQYKKEVGGDVNKLKTWVMGAFPSSRRHLKAEDVADPDKYIKERMSENERRIAYGRETSSHGRIQARQVQDRILHAMNIEEYAINKSADTVSDAALFAMERTKKANKELKKQGMEQIDPIYISPENIFQESFGSHPQELKKIIVESRKAMEKKLVQSGYKEKEAEKLAEKHIAGTFDIGHANIWKKYYKGDPKKTPEENEKDFKKWIIDEAKDLIKGGFIKHIHIADNLGFHDEHLAVGQGSAPIKEFIEELEKAGLKDVIIEPGSTNFMSIWPDSIRAMGSPIYALQGVYADRTFDQVHQAYAGQTPPPYFLVGESSPSEEWKLWSQTPLE